MSPELQEALMAADTALLEALRTTEQLVDEAIKLRVKAMEEHERRLAEAKATLEAVEDQIEADDDQDDEEIP
jgi:hypothetical protein